MNKLLFIMLLFPLVCFSNEKWEVFNCKLSDLGPCAYRMKVDHGWFITRGYNESSITFYPDEKHEWRIDK